MKHLLISSFWTLWYSLQPWDDWGSKLISLIHFCSTCKKARCHLLSVSSTDDLSILSSSWVSSGATFLTAEAVGESSLVVCFSHWAGGENADFSTDIFQLCWMKVTKKIQELYELSTFIILWPSWRSIDIYLYYIYNILYIYIMYIYIHCGWWSEAIRPLTVDRGWFNHPILGPMIWHRRFRCFKFVGFPFYPLVN